MKDIERLIRELGLEPHPLEGGWFAETYRSREHAAGGRSLSTAIYYLLTADTFSAMHRLAGDEIFHFYAGDPVEMLLLESGGRGRRTVLGPDIAAGQRPQVVVPGGQWQGSRLVSGGAAALMGTTMSPGFDARDYEPGDAEALVRAWPTFEADIRARTR